MPPAASQRSARRPGRAVPAMLAASALLLLGVSGCADDAPADNAATDDGESTVLTVYGWKGGDTEPANIEAINAAFEAAHPDIDVQFEFVPANDTYTQRVQPELLAGDSADVIMTDAGKVQTWGESGFLENLGDSAWVSTVLPEVDPFIRQDGTVYALPMEVIGIDLYANMALLDQAGVTEVPTTWPEFEAALQAVQDAGITPLALPSKAGWTGASTVAAIAATRVYQENPDWDAEFLAGDASFSDWRSSVDQFLSLQEKGFIDLRAELGVDEWSQGLGDFTSGGSAFWVQGAWNIGAVEAAGVEPVFMPWPAADEGEESSANLFVGTMWSITAESDVKDAARTYLEFWADAANAGPFLEAENAVAPFQGASSPSTPATADFVAAFEAGRYHVLPSNTWFGTAGEKILQEQTQALMLGDLSVDDYLASLDDLLRAVG